MPRESIFEDLDGLSVILTCAEPLTGDRRTALKDFLLTFGRRALKCGLPSKGTGSKTREGMFGCFGNESHHLPHLLSGNEVLVIDTPIKIALHSSCKQKLIECLHDEGTHLFPASAASGVCFDSNAAASKPCYEKMVDAVIDSCAVQHTRVIHVADMGFRLPLEEHDSMHDVFGGLQGLRDHDITFEVTQCDIAFSFKVDPNHLVQARCKKSTGVGQNDNSLLWRSRIHSHPIHESDLSSHRFGTVVVKKQKWEGGGRPTLLASGNEDHELNKCHAQDVEHLFAAASASEHGRNSIEVLSSTLHSIKLYSSIAHGLLQRRNKYPMTLEAMYGAPGRSIQSLQTLVKNLSSAADEVFQIVSDHGIALRLEVSVRPHLKDDLRSKGHFNDMLLVAYVAVSEFCAVCQPEHRTFNAGPAKTKVMKLANEANSMLTFRHSGSFRDFYTNCKAWDWLRAHLSHLMITSGICPEFDLKYIKIWLKDSYRFDPHHLAQAISPTKSRIHDITRDRDVQKEALSRHLDKRLRHHKFLREDRHTLTTFATTFTGSGQSVCYRSLSFESKHLLAEHLWSDLIPHMSELLSAQDERDDQRKREIFGSLSLVKGSEEPSWTELGILPHHVLEDQVREAPLPVDPVALAIVSLTKLGSMFSPDRPGQPRTLCHFFLLCLKRQILPWLPTHVKKIKKIKKTLTRCADGSHEHLTGDLQYICRALSLVGKGNRSSTFYMRTLCKACQFPLSTGDGEPLLRVSLSPQKSSNRLRNKLLNIALSENIAVRVKPTTPSLGEVFYRVSDSNLVTIPPRHKVFHEGDCDFTGKVKFSHSSLYVVLAEALHKNEDAMRKVLHRHASNLNDVMGSLFLSEDGCTHPLFQGVDGLTDLQKKHQFMLLKSFKICEFPKSCNEVPEIVVAIVCLTCQVAFTVYDFVENKSCLFRFSDQRVVVYTEVGTRVIPNTQSICIQRASEARGRQPKWSLLDQTHESSIPKAGGRSKDKRFCFDPTGGRIRSAKSLKKVSNLIPAPAGQSFYSALSKLLKMLDRNYVVNKEKGSDHFGLIDMLKELSSVPREFSGFDQSTLDSCSWRWDTVGALLRSLQQVPPSDWPHSIICALTCLKYSNLTLAVFDNSSGQPKKTVCYFFDKVCSQVVTKLLGQSYTILVDRPKVLYLYTNGKKSQHCSPSKEIPQPWSDSVHGKFSHLDDRSFLMCINHLETPFNLMVCELESIKPHEFRPEKPRPVIVPTHVKCSSASGFKSMLQTGVKHHALIVIFPSEGNECWDTCIVHHPLQDEAAALAVLKTFTSGAPPSGQYNTRCLRARESTQCESGFNYLLYALLAGKCESLSSFERLLTIAHRELDLTDKIKQFVCDEFCVTNRRRLPPAWFEMLSATKSSITESDRDLSGLRNSFSCDI